MAYKKKSAPVSSASLPDSPSPAASFAAVVEEWARWAERYGAELERELQDTLKRQHSGVR